jgi:hypothetical protein
MTEMMVVTVSGKRLTKDKCRRIGDDYYEIGDPKVRNSGECYYLQHPDPKKTRKGFYYKADSDKLVWNATENSYMHSEDPRVKNLITGIIDCDKDGNLERGLMQRLPETEQTYFQDQRGSTHLVLSPSIFMKCKYINEKGHIGAFYDNRVTALVGTKKVGYGSIPTNLYNMKDMPKSTKITIEKDSKEYVDNLIEEKNISPKLQANINELLDTVTFGFEQEVSEGNVPKRFLHRYAYLPLKDGSIQGHEYTSLPLKSFKGLLRVQKFTEALQKYCNVDKNTSLHIHFGNLFPMKSTPKSRGQLVAFYLLMLSVRSDMWGMLPPYKLAGEYFHKKKDGKNHCQDLPKLAIFHQTEFTNLDKTLKQTAVDKAYNEIHRFINCGVEGDPDQRQYAHGNDTNKWNINSRYYLVNFWNFFFNNANTIEFRAHSGTVNPIKTMAWFWITYAVLRYAMDNYKSILDMSAKYTLTEVVKEYYGQFEGNDYAKKLTKFLPAYIISRTLEFQTQIINKDIYREFKGDKKFTFKNASDILIS